MADEREGAAKVVPCSRCGGPVRSGARRCPHCRGPQGRPPLWRRPLAWVAAATTVLSLFFAAERLYGAWSSGRELARSVTEHVATARILLESGDHAAAWRSLADAQELDPTAREVGIVQVEVASAWLRSAGPTMGWVPQGEGGGETPGAIAETVYVPLVTAAVAAEGTERAELEGIAVWARYLRGREMLARRRDITEDLESAREHDPGAYYPSLLLGFWRASMKKDPAAAKEPWSRALDAASTPEDLRFLRLMEMWALRELMEGSAPEEDAARRTARAMYLRTLDQMRDRGESPEGLAEAGTLASLYLGRLSREDRFSELAQVLSPAAQLTLVEWLSAAVRPPDFEEVRFHLIRGRLLEDLGRTEDAREEIAKVLAMDTNNTELRERAGEAWKRLTGEAAMLDDEWTARARALKDARFDEPAFREAFDAVQEIVRDWPYWQMPRSETAQRALDAAIERLSSELGAAAPGAEVLGAPRAEVEANLRTLRCYRGGYRVDWQWSVPFVEGTRELEALLRDPALSPELRRSALADLAMGYTYSPRATMFDLIQSDSEYAVAMVYLSEGLDRLSAALDAGFSDWKWIEERLKPLRSHPGYAQLSLRHHRTPPRDDDG